ncbi:ATP-binding protein (plasmid) [Photobacterium sp. DA100]|uniref:ATP-binding protein n=1 Tax=Photobacterium sp. DA100 TaxID=3027472 RepID=UPI00247AE6BE|nr:ATP-binding protein [Photobacterium sp. DA100]WEM44650.1 ATP-binding protein [Photobacterium sp. DA100]
MKRLYLEFFVGLSGLFFLCIFAFSFVTQELTTDYEAELEISYVSSVMQILDDVAAQRGQEKADTLLAGYAERSHLTYQRFSWDEIGLSQAQHDKLSRRGALFEGENQYWVVYGDQKWVYFLQPDPEQDLWQMLDLEFKLLWVSFFATFALYSAIMLKLLSNRFRKLENATMAFSNGEFTVRASEKAGDRVGRLNARFNQMADKISELIQSHKHLTNAIAHELRTPLFRMQCQLDLLEESALDAEQKKHLGGIYEDVDELEALIEELLYFAKMERSGVTLQLQQQDVAEVLQRTIVHCQKDTSKQLVLDCPEHCYFDVDAHHLERAVSNIIRNAFRYAEQCIVVSAFCQQGALTIQVDDDGCGIPPKERENVLKPFYRVGTSRDRQSGGHGLGLAIVAQVVSLHKGELLIGESDSGGARFTIYLPEARCQID